MSAGNLDLLLATKLSVPPLRATTIPRPALQERIVSPGGAQLTLLSAPAGFGKTTLLHAWAAGRPVAWVSLDADDNDPARFWAYVLTALARTSDGLREPIGTLLRTFDPAAVKASLTSLINVLAAANEPLVLVLDDYHLVTSRPIHDAVALLIDNMPPSLRLVLASRADPPLPLARLRSRGLLAEVRAEDLRFTSQEAEALIRPQHPSLTAEDIAALYERTEGWAAGLQLALIALERHPDPQAFVRTFTGSHRTIADYLFDEVLHQQPPAVQRFLLQTSILSRLSGPLCDAVVGLAPGSGEAPTGQALLEAIDRANLFVVPLDDERRWYRYHHLFAEFLRELLNRSAPASVPELNRRAAQWYARAGATAEAFGYALAAGDHPWAADLLVEASHRLLVDGEVTTLLGWIDQLPPDLIAARPTLAFNRAWALVQIGDFERTTAWVASIEQLLAVAEQHPAGGEAARRERRAEVLALRALMTAAAGDVALAGELASEGLALLPDERRDHVRAALHVIDGVVAAMRGATAHARQALVSASAALSEQEHDLFGLTALTILSSVYEAQGELRQAFRLAHQATRHSAETPGHHPVAISYATIGRILYEWNDLTGARQALASAFVAVHRVPLPIVAADYYITLAQVQVAEGDPDAALLSFAEGERILRESSGLYPAEELIDVRRAELALLLDRAGVDIGRLVLSTTTAPSGRLPDVSHPLTRELVGIMRAQLALRDRKLAEAGALLAELLPLAEQQQRLRSVVQVLSLQALVHQSAGNLPAALVALERALGCAESEGYVRTFIDLGEAIRPLLRAIATGEGSQARYAWRLLGHFGGPQHKLVALPSAAAVDLAPALGMETAVRVQAEPLSDREQEVLRLLASEHTSREIAELLVIAPSTLKVHVRNIYSKLGVHSRSQAILRAQSLALLPG